MKQNSSKQQTGLLIGTSKPRRSSQRGKVLQNEEGRSLYQFYKKIDVYIMVNGKKRRSEQFIFLSLKYT